MEPVGSYKNKAIVIQRISDKEDITLDRTDENDKEMKDNSSHPIQKPPTLMEKIGVIFSNTKKKGYKDGYSKAAAEYRTAYSDLLRLYNTYKVYLKEAKESGKARAEHVLKELEKLRDCLQSEVTRRCTECERQYALPEGTITDALACRGETGHRFYYDGSAYDKQLINIPVINWNIINVLYKMKDDQRQKAEEKGYLECRNIFWEKLQMLRKEFAEDKAKGDKELEGYVDLINDILYDIALARARLAELKTLE